jgi:D-proline reductase (dithiol) PrdB
VGLIARSLEAAGIATVSISLARELTQAVGAPRAVFLKWPLGHPLGEPEQRAQQRTVIFDALQTLLTAEAPGTIVEPGYRWRRHHYTEPDWIQLVTVRPSAPDA